MAIIFSGNGVINTNGVVPIAQGGTGQITPGAAINALLPSQSGKSGQILSTDGSTVSWIVNTGGGGSGSGVGLPEQTGASGNFLTTDGTTAYWSPVIAAGIQAGGVDGQLQFNSNNVLTATPKMSYNNLDVLFVGGGTSDTFKIEGVDAFDNTYTGTTILIKGGDSFANPLPTATPPAGDVIIMGGGGFGQGAAGNIIFKVGRIQAETFRITNTGAWALGGDQSLVGSAGNILVSQGSDGPPIWVSSPIATSTVLGGVKVAANSGLTIDSTGFISANIKRADGSTIKNVDGQISVDLYKVLPELPVNTSKFLKATSTSTPIFTVEWASVELNDVLPDQTGKDGLVLVTNGNTANWASTYPDQTDKAGQFLVTDGTTVSWSPNPSTIATTEGIGAVKPDGSTITITEDGTVSANVNSILPDQTGNENKLLTTDGTSVSWVAAPEEYVLPVSSNDTLGGVMPGIGVTISPTGTINLSPATAQTLGGIKPGPMTILYEDGTFGLNVQIASSQGLGMIKVGSGLSINSDGVLSATGDGGFGGGGSGTVTEVEISSTDLSVTTSPITSSGKIAIGLGLNTVPVNKGGTGVQQIGVGELLVGSAGNTYGTIAPAATFNVLLSNGVDARPVYGKVNLNNHVAGVLPVERGGTGATTPQGAVENLFGFTPVNKSGDTMTGPLTLVGAPTSELHAATKKYVEQYFEQNSGKVNEVEISSTDLSVTTSPITSSGKIAISLDLNTVPVVRGGTGLQGIFPGELLVGGPPAAIVTYGTIAPVAEFNVLLSKGVGVRPVYGKVSLNNHVEGILPVERGGTGATTPQGAVENLLGFTPLNKAGDTMTGSLTLSVNPTEPFHAVTKQYFDTNTGKVNQVEISSTDLSVTTSPITSSGKIAIGLGLNTVPVVRGGTGLQGIGVGELLVGSAGNTYETIAPAATFNVLLSNGVGVRPVYGKVSLNNHVEGILPVERGGTGATTPQGAVQNLLGFTPLNKAGDTMTGPLTLVGAPTSELHAVTKKYVDNVLSGFNVKPEVIVATTGNISATYNNAEVGGATLTGLGALPLIDGVSLQQNERVLVKNQTNSIQNGVYVLETINPFVLRRAADAGNNTMRAGDAYFVKNGTQNSTQWVMATSGTITVGTTEIVYLQFGGPSQLSAGLGIEILSGSINNKGVVNINGGSNITASAKDEFGNVTIGFDGVLQANKGGTGHSEYATGDLLYASDETTLSKIPVGAAGQILTVVGDIPTWNSPVISSIAVNQQKGFKGEVNNSNGVVDITISTTVGGLLKGNSTTGEVISAVVDIDYALPYQSGAGININDRNIINTGILSISGGSDITVSAKDEFGNVTIGFDGVLQANKGGTGHSEYATGDLLYASDETTLSKIPVGAAGQILTVVGNTPTWNSPVISSIAVNQQKGFKGEVNNSNGVVDITISTTTSGLLKGNSTTGEVISAVADIDYALPYQSGAGININDRNIINTGIVNITGGSDITVSAKDEFGNVTIGFDGVLSTEKGGTGHSEYATGDLLYASDETTLSKIPVGAAGQILTVVGDIPTWNSPVISSIAVNQQKGFKGDVNNSNGVVDITISTTTSGLLKGNSTTGEVISAVAGIDYQAPISVTTTGTSGPATLVDGVLNIPQYSGGGSGGGGSEYTLPTASDIVLGGVKVDNTTITIANGVISSKINALLPTQDSQSGKFLTTNGAGTLSWDSLDVSAATSTELGGIKIDSAVSEIDEAGFYKTTKLSLNSQQNKQILFNDNGVSSTAGKLLYNNTELNVGAATDAKFDIISATDLNLIAADEKNVSIKTKELKIYTYNDSQYAMLESCRTVTTANITFVGGNATTRQISAGSDLALFDNIDINVGDRILFKNQDNQSQNRVYVMTLKNHPVVWMFTIVSDFEDAITNDKIPVVEITEGSLSGSKLQGTINESNITWVDFDPSILYTKNFEILRTGAVSFGPTTNIGTQGQTLISNASSQAPTWGTLGISGGGTGKTSFGPGFLKSDGSEITSTFLSEEDIPSITSDKLSNTVPVNKGGTGATSLTGYLVGSGENPITAVSKIPLSDIQGTITINSENINGLVTVEKGGTNANNAATARANLNAVSKSGDTISGPLILNYNPTQALEAVNKSYVDSYVSGLVVRDSVKTATQTNLSATYNNGTNGVGATLSFPSSPGEVNGILLNLNDRVLVRSQTNTIENGIYILTSVSTPWILTRATDFNSNSTVIRGAAMYVTEGNLTGTQWVMTADIVNVGIEPIKFTQFTGPGIFIGESGIIVDGNTITNSGVTKLLAGDNISVTGQTGDITVSFNGVLPITKGGTGLSTTSPGYLFSNGTALSYSSTISVASLNGTVLVDNGGTGASTPEQARTNLGAAKSGTNTDIVTMLGIKEIVSPSGNYGQTDLLIKAGAGTFGQSGGNLMLESGTPGFNSSAAGQSVYIDMPVISSSPNGGSFAIRHKLISGSVLDSSVSHTHRFGINRQGAFTIGETMSTGNTGQFLKSNGINSAPTWSNLPSINEVLPSQTGREGRFLQSDGTNVTWQSMNTIPINGNNGEMLYNWNGAVTPATNMVFNNIDTLSLGTISGLNKQDLFYFKTPNGQRNGNSVLAPMGISFKPGTQVEANGAPGNVFIGGSSATGVGSQGGSVYLDGGNSTFSQGGSVIIRTTSGPGTSLVNRLAIVPNGAWNINGSTGILGQVLISSGSSASPEWRNATVDAQYIIGTTLASNVVNSSLTKVGTLTNLNVAGSVGIGTTTPKAPLSVSLGNSAEGIEFVPSVTSSSIRAINRASDTFSPIEVGGSTLTLRTISGVNLTDRLKITSTGSWELNGLAGPAGYVLTNKGPNFPPAWEAGIQTINGGTTGLTFTKNDTEITVAGTLNVSNGGTEATTAIQASQNVANFGNLRSHTTVTDFNMVREWGATYVAGNSNGPTGVPSPYDQSYQLMLSLGSDYSWNSNQIYAAQIAIPRNATNPVMSIRFKEGGASTSNWGTWQKITAGLAETLSQTLAINKGGTGATTPAAAARALLTPGSTDNGKYLKWDANSNVVMWDKVIVDTTQITGIIPHQNGGTGGGSRQAGLNSLAGVIGALANTVLRFDGSNVLLDKLNVSTDISGTLPIANGGTGASTQAAAARAILPPQSGATVNNFLMSDGTNSSWKTAVTSVNVSGLQTGLIFSGGPITTTGTFELSGVLKVSNGGTGANFLTAGFVKSNGSNAFTSVAGITSADISGTLGIDKGGTGASTQPAAARAILAPQSGDSGKVLVTDGTNVSWGNPSTGASSFTGVLPVDKGGTGATTVSAAINALLPTQTSNNGRYLSTNGSTASWQTISITPDNITGTLTTGKGGTGISSYSNGDLLVGNSSNTLSRLPVGSANQVLTLVNGIPAWSTPTVSAGGSAAGEIQYRSSTGTLAASNTFTFNTSTNKVSFTNVPQIGSGASALDIGYLVLPRTTTFDANAKGKRVALTAGITIPANVYAAGDAFSFYNDSASPITLTQGSGLTLRKDGTTTTGNLVLAARGTALLWFNSATEAILTGSIT
jgi:hypothetical protein